MKKIIIYAIIIFGILSWFFIRIVEKIDNDRTVKVDIIQLNNSIAYAPQYIALAKHYFKDNHIEPNIVTISDYKVFKEKLLSKNNTIGLTSIKTSLDIYNNKNYIINIAKITKKDTSFIVSRKIINNFKFGNLINKNILVGNFDSLSSINFKLSNENINITSFITNNASIRSFYENHGDFILLDDINAIDSERKEAGYIIASSSVFEKDFPSLVYEINNYFISNDKKKTIINEFRNSLNKALLFIYNNDSETIAKNIYNYFPNLSMNELIKIIDIYKKNKVWSNNVNITKKDFNNAQQIMILSDNMIQEISYNKIVKNNYK